MKKQSIQFQADSLRAAIEAASDVIENHANLRDQVSTDIKNLELYLESNAPKEDFSYSLGEGFVVDDESLLRQTLEEYGSGSGEMQEELLIWRASPKGRFRLYYEFRRWEACIEVDCPGGPYFGDKSTMVCDSKPLIETSFEIRKSMFQHLPEFVKAMASHISVKSGVQIPDENEDVPF